MKRPFLITELREFRADRTAKEVARILRRCPQVVRNEARRRNLPLARETRGASPAKRERAQALRARGESFQRIGAALGVSDRAVRFWLGGA